MTTFQEAPVKAHSKTAFTRPARASMRKKRKVPVLVVASIVWLTLITLAVLLQPFLPLHDPAVSDYSALRMAPFSDWSHPLGTDTLGRDMLSRTISGAGVSLTVGVGSTVIALIAGMAIGTSAGYFGGIWDRAVSWIIDILLAFPMIVALIALTTFLGPNIGTMTIGLGIFATPLVSRLARATTHSYAQRDFVAAAKVSGSSHFRIIQREIIPNVSLVVIPFSLTMIALAVTAEGALSFLGLGVPPPQASWGGLMSEGRTDLSALPHIVFAPAIVMTITLLALSFIADWTNRLTDRREARM